MDRPIIDWSATAHNIRLLRCDNIKLRQKVCHCLSSRIAKGHVCRTFNCDGCTVMDSQISQAELSIVLGVSDSIIANWENGRSIPTLEDLLMYAKVADVNLMDIVVVCDKAKEKEKN